MSADQSRPVPRASEAQGIDRDAVLAAIRECAPAGMELRYDGTEDVYAAAYVAGVQAAHDAADRILALVRPVEGVTLTPEQAHNAATCVRMVRQGAVSDPYSAAELDALAARLEASS